MTKLETIELIIIIAVAVAFIVWLALKAIKNKWVSSIVDTVNSAMKEAENSKQSGEEKKKYVLMKVEEKCTDLKIPYTLIFKLVSKLIDAIVKHYNILSK